MLPAFEWRLGELPRHIFATIPLTSSLFVILVAAGILRLIQIEKTIAAEVTHVGAAGVKGTESFVEIILIL